MKKGMTGFRQPSIADQSPKTFYWHYAWVIVAIIAIMQMVGASIRMAFGVFIDPLTQEFSWNQGSITFAYALSSIMTAVASPFAGSVGDRYGARRAMILGTFMFFVGMILTGMISELWHLYLTFGVLLGTAQAIFLVPLIPAAMHWFRRNLGLGMGVLMAAWGLGPALAAPLMGFLIQRFGWQDTFWITAIGSVTIMSVMIIMFRDRPSDRGDSPYGALPGDPIPEKTTADPDRLRRFSQFMRHTAAFWNMSSIHMLGCVGHAVILVYIIPIAVLEGISLIMAASFLTIMSGVSVGSRFFVPIMAERMGTRTVMVIAYILQGVPVVMLYWTHDAFMFYVFVIIFGIGYGGESGGFPILNRKYFGHAPVGSAYGFQMFGAGLGMAVGGWIGGVIFDMTGGYGLALAVSIIASLAGAISIALLEPTHKPLIPDWESPLEASDTRSPISAG